jgi:hypothetical protein
MDIKSVSNSNSVYVPKDLPQKGKDQNESKEIKIQDKLELSEEAKNIQNSTNIQQNKLDKVSERISSGFYNSNEVISKVADKIYQEIKQTK